MVAVEAEVAEKASATTRREVVVKALAGVITSTVAATILGMSDRHLQRIRARCEQYGVHGLMDSRAGRSRAWRVTTATIQELCQLKRDVCPDFSMKHLHQVVTEKHGLTRSYTLMGSVL